MSEYVKSDYVPHHLLEYMKCHRCGAIMRYSRFTNVGVKPNDIDDNFYYVHDPEIPCKVKDYVIKVGHGFED